MSNTHAPNKATRRIEKTMPATSQYSPQSPPPSTAMPATTNGRTRSQNHYIDALGGVNRLR
jgi:hypothetical protein